MFTCTLRSIIIWCLLQTVCAENGIEPAINYNALNDLPDQSILLHGSKIQLSEWLSSYGVDDSKSEHHLHVRNSKIFYTFVKCECASNIRDAVGSVHDMLNDDAGGKRNDSAAQKISAAVPLLGSVNRRISLAMSRLLEIGDMIPAAAKLHEPYFLKILLTAYVYVEGLERPDGGGGNSLGNDSKRKRDKKLDQQRLFAMVRVLLQIVNFVEAFAIEHCGSGAAADAGKKIRFPTGDNRQQRVVQERLDVFEDFLRKVVVNSDVDSPAYPAITVDGLLLGKCMKYTLSEREDHDERDFRLCLVFLQTSTITAAAGGAISIRSLHAKVERAHDAESVYEFMLAVYKALLKLIFRESANMWNDRDNRLAAERCDEVVSKLRSMGCPIELVHHFEFVSKVQRYRESGRISDAELKKTADVYADVNHFGSRYGNAVIPEHNGGLVNLPLPDLMDVIVDERFEQFWRVFNVLYRESEGRSDRVYDLRLNLFAAAAAANDTEGLEKKNPHCNALISIYLKLFDVERENESCLSNGGGNTRAPSQDGIDNCFETARSGYESLSNNLLDEVTKCDNYIQCDDELQNVVFNAVILLRNELNADAGGFPEDKRRSRNFVLGKQEKLKRIGDVIMNSLDNYQIRNCKVLQNREFLLRANRDGGGSSSSMLGKFGRKPKNVFTFNCERCKKTANRNRSSPKSDDNGKSEDFYNISKLLGKSKREEPTVFETAIFFNWRGDVKNIREIQTDIAENMVNIRDLVEYERLYLQWLIHMYYTAWFVIFERIRDTEGSKNFTTDFDTNFRAAQNSLNDFNTIAEFPKICRKYKDYYNLKLSFLNMLSASPSASKGKNLCSLMKEELLEPLAELLGVVKVVGNVTYADIENLFTDLSTDVNEIYRSLLDFIKNVMSDVKKHFIFTGHTLKTFKFTYPHSYFE